VQKSFSDMLEQKVTERTFELQKMNVELESFAYVASHDLQEPLRKIQTYSDRILDKELMNLSEGGKEYFRRLQSAANRMQTLINDLLDYSRTNNTSVQPEQTNLDELLQDVLNEYKDVIAAKEAVIENKGLVTIPVIPYQFRQVMQNLIGNSLKFSRPGVPPVLKISSEIKSGKDLLPVLSPDQKYSHFTFSDNGIGFDPQYRKRIFEMFQRLNGRSEYEGTGIGLAIVNKIVENHKGIITADSEPGQGSVFQIYIPV
jgi:signal transduction histidine kinase